MQTDTPSDKPTPPDAEAGVGAPADLAQHEPVLGRARAGKLFKILGGAAVAVIALWALVAFMSAGRESTDDAQVTADVVPVAARAAGQVIGVHVRENEKVHAGQGIADIDPADAKLRLQRAEADLETARAAAGQARAKITVAEAGARGTLTTARSGVQSARNQVGMAAGQIGQAQAAVARAEANAARTRLDAQRAEALGAKGDVSRAEVDGARAAAQVAEADLALARAQVLSAQDARSRAVAGIGEAQGRLQSSTDVGAEIAVARGDADLAAARIKTAEAAVAEARLAVEHTHVVAPADGIAAHLAVHPGSVVAVGQPICQLVPTTTYVVANFKETQVREMRAGQRVKVTLDVLKGDYQGTVESVSGGTGAAFSMLPPDNASGNFIKVVQRVPVRIAWSGPSSAEAPVGASAEVTVYTK